jgi:hypothetical protein
MAITTTPEILPPGSRVGRSWRERAAAGLFDDKNLDLLSHLLDDFLRVPGTPIRFGLDGIVGFIPGLGDVAGGLASTILIVAAWVRGVPRIVLARMVLNVAIETLAGSVPVLGNLFDIGWRANRRNYALLADSVGASPELRRRHTIVSWLIFSVLFAALWGIILLPAFLFAWLIMHLRHAG